MSSVALRRKKSVDQAVSRFLDRLGDTVNTGYTRDKDYYMTIWHQGDSATKLKTILYSIDNSTARNLHDTIALFLCIITESVLEESDSEDEDLMDLVMDTWKFFGKGEIRLAMVKCRAIRSAHER